MKKKEVKKNERESLSNCDFNIVYILSMQEKMKEKYAAKKLLLFAVNEDE